MSRRPAFLPPGDDTADIQRAMVENSELIRELEDAGSKPMPFWPPRRVEDPANDPLEHMDAGDGLTHTDVLMVALFVLFLVLAGKGSL